MLQIDRRLIAALLVGALTVAVHATKPPGYVEPLRPVDPHPPRYAYGYAVESNGANATDGGGGGGGQGHRESRDGDNTQGNYYVNFANGQAQASVEYVADDWGYHPIVRYSSHDDHSRVTSHFALGESAVERLRGEPSHQTAKIPHVPQQQQQQQLGPLVQVIPMLDYVPSNQGPLHYNPEQLQIIGVVPQEHPKSLHGLQSDKTTVIYPLAPNYEAAGDPNVPFVVDSVEPKQISESSELLDKTKSLINGFDVIDINHSAEAVAQNSLFQVASEEDQYGSAASDGQQQAVLKQESEAAQEAAKNEVNAGFSTPIVVDDQPHPTSESPEVSIKPNRARYSPDLAKQPKQINLQIFDNNHDEFLKESSLEPDHDSDSIRIPEAPSRHFVHSFNLAPERGTTPTISSDYDAVPPNESVTPAIQSEPCDDHEHISNPQTIFRVDKEVNIKSVLLDEKTYTPTPSPVYGSRIIPSKPTFTSSADEPITYVTSERSEQILYHKVNPTVEIQQQILIPYPAENHIEKSIGHHSAQPLSIGQIVNDHIDGATEVGRSAELHTNVVDNLSLEKYIDRPVPYPVPVEKIVHRPYPVERIVERIVERPVERIVEKEVRVPYPVQQFVEKIVERPVEKIVDRPVPFPYPVEVKQYVDRPYAVERIVEKEVPIPYTVDKIIERPADGQQIADTPIPIEPIHENYVSDNPPQTPVNHIINRPYPVEVKLPVGIPYAVQVPVHLPLTYQQALAPVYSPPNHNYLPPFQPLPPHHSPVHNHLNTKAFYFKNTLDHNFQPQPAHLKQYQPIQQHHNPGKHTLLPPLHTLPAHLHYYQSQPVHHAGPSQQPAGSFHASTTRLHAIRPHHYSTGPVRPVYGVPTHLAALPNAHNAAGPPPALLANYRSQHSYAGSFGYAPSGAVYRDEYAGPPPPLPAASDQHHQYMWTSFARGPPPPSIGAAATNGHRPAAVAVESDVVASASIHSSQIRSPNALAAAPVQPERSNVAADLRRNLNFGKSMRWENGFRPPLVPSVQTDEHGVPLNDVNGGQ